jgi:molybdate transport system substrate-binding protein
VTDHSKIRELCRGAIAAAYLAAAALVLPVSAQAQEHTTTVFAAASMKDALDAVMQSYQAQGGGKVTASYAASGPLAKQIENGAPADLLISANEEWMDYLAKRGLIDDSTRADFAGNSLVLIAPKDAPLSLTIAPGFPLAAALGDGRLAMGDPASVPAGTYAKASLEHLGVWDSVSGKTAYAADVRAVLVLVERGEAPAGIVYATDAAASGKVAVVGTFPEDSHPPIAYPIAVTKSAADDARAFYKYLRSPAAQAIFKKYGFTTP